MSDSVSISRLRFEFKQFRADGCICGSMNLRALAAIADAVAMEGGQNRLAAFLLSSILYDIAEKQDDRPVQSDEIAAVWKRLGQPVIRCVDLLLGVEHDSAGIIGDVLDAYFEIREII